MRSTFTVMGWEQKYQRPISENLNRLDLPLNNALHGSIIIIKRGMVGGGDSGCDVTDWFQSVPFCIFSQ